MIWAFNLAKGWLCPNCGLGTMKQTDHVSGPFCCSRTCPTCSWSEHIHRSTES